MEEKHIFHDGGKIRIWKMQRIHILCQLYSKEWRFLLSPTVLRSFTLPSYSCRIGFTLKCKGFKSRALFLWFAVNSVNGYWSWCGAGALYGSHGLSVYVGADECWLVLSDTLGEFKTRNVPWKVLQSFTENHQRCSPKWDMPNHWWRTIKDVLSHSNFECIHHFTSVFYIWISDMYPPHLSYAEGLWPRLSSDRTHRGEQVQHLRFSRVAQQEEAHVCGTECQRQANEGEEDTEEKHSRSLPAHDGTTTIIGHISHDRALQTTSIRLLTATRAICQIWIRFEWCTEEEKNGNLWTH